MGPKVLKLCTMMRWRFLKPSIFQKLYKLNTPFFHSPGISLKGLTMLPLSEYDCRITGILLLRRTPDFVSSSTQDRGRVAGLRHTLHLAISTRKNAHSALPSTATLALPGTCRAKEGGRRLVYRVSPPCCAGSRLSSLAEYIMVQYVWSWHCWVASDYPLLFNGVLQPFFYN